MGSKPESHPVEQVEPVLCLIVSQVPLLTQRLVVRRAGRFRHHPGVLWGAMGGGESSEKKKVGLVPTAQLQSGGSSSVVEHLLGVCKALCLVSGTAQAKGQGRMS